MRSRGISTDGSAKSHSGRVSELLAYPNADAEAAWDGDDPDSDENSMLYLIVRPDDITVVLDNPETPEMRSILGAIRELLWTDILRHLCEGRMNPESRPSWSVSSATTSSVG